MQELRTVFGTLAHGGRQCIAFLYNHKLHLIVAATAVCDIWMLTAEGYGFISGPEDVTPRGLVPGLRPVAMLANIATVFIYWASVAEGRKWKRATASKAAPLQTTGDSTTPQQETDSMDAKQSHGVVIIGQSTGSSLIHKPHRAHGSDAMKSDDWELFPNLQTAIEAGNKICLSCFKS